MVKKIRFLDDASLDVFEAIKRAFIRRGSIPRRHRIRETEQPQSKKTAVAVTKAEVPNPESSEDIEPAEGPEKLVDLTANAHEVLLEATTVFPFMLFPDTVTIDREKLTIANRFFFRVAKINSIPITDIQSIEANVGPFFGSIRTTSRYFVSNPRIVKFLWRQDALKIQRLLQGYIIAHQKEVDCATIDKEQLIILLNDLGQGVSD